MSNSYPFHYLMVTQGFLFVLQKEMASQMQKHTVKGTKKNSADMGSRPMFEYYIWINNMRDLVRNLTNYGLFPTVNPNCIASLLLSSGHYVSMIQQTELPTSHHSKKLGRQYWAVLHGLKRRSVPFLTSNSRQTLQYPTGFTSTLTTSSMSRLLT